MFPECNGVRANLAEQIGLMQRGQTSGLCMLFCDA